MRIFLAILIIPLFTFFAKAQTTAIPDPNFEQELINLGLDTVLDGQVLTTNIDTVTNLYIGGKNISDLTGIEDFIALTTLLCINNQLTSLNVTQNTGLIYLVCYSNQITSLNVTQNTGLVSLVCDNNQLSSLDLSQNTGLAIVHCGWNQLTCLNIKNGNNVNITQFSTSNNLNLTCFEVDNVAYSNTNWTGSNYAFDSQQFFSTNCNNACSTVGLKELTTSTINIYPNPTTGTITIDLGEVKANLTITLSNNLGQIVFTKHYETTNFINLDIDAPNGIYFLQLQTENGKVTTKKIVKE